MLRTIKELLILIVLFVLFFFAFDKVEKVKKDTYKQEIIELEYKLQLKHEESIEFIDKSRQRDVLLHTSLLLLFPKNKEQIDNAMTISRDQVFGSDPNDVKKGDG